MYPPHDFLKCVKPHIFRMLYHLIEGSAGLEASLRAASDVPGCYAVVSAAAEVERGLAAVRGAAIGESAEAMKRPLAASFVA